MATTMTTGTAAISSEFQTFYDRTLLRRLLPNLIHSQWGQKRVLPQGWGKQIQFRRFESLSANTTALTEGTVPSGTTLSVTAITATISQYGDFVQISDLVDFTALDPVLTETAMLLGEQAGNSLDQIVRDVIIAGSTVQYANGRAARANVAAGDNISSTEIRKGVRTLKRNNAKPFDDGFYVALAHPDTIYDLQADATWQNAQLYAGSTNMFSGEVGRYWGVRFVESTGAKKFTGAGSGSIDVYGTLVVAPNYYGIVDLAGEGAVKSIVKPLGSAGTSDPLNQIATSGWKAIFTSVRLNENCAVRVEHAASA